MSTGLDEMKGPKSSQGSGDTILVGSRKDVEQPALRFRAIELCHGTEHGPLLTVEGSPNGPWRVGNRSLAPLDRFQDTAKPARVASCLQGYEPYPKRMTVSGLVEYGRKILIFLRYPTGSDQFSSLGFANPRQWQSKRSRLIQMDFGSTSENKVTIMRAYSDLGQQHIKSLYRLQRLKVDVLVNVVKYKEAGSALKESKKDPYDCP